MAFRFVQRVFLSRVVEYYVKRAKQINFKLYAQKLHATDSFIDFLRIMLLLDVIIYITFDIICNKVNNNNVCMEVIKNIRKEKSK